MLDGVRGMAPVDREAVASLLMQVSRIACAGADIAEIDLNPVIAGPGGLVIADARVILDAAR
jgi:acetyltransferase